MSRISLSYNTMWCIVYLASPRSFGRHEILKASLRITKRCFPTTDIYVFHEGYTAEDFADLPPIREAIPVDFTGFDHVHDPAFGRKGYLMMCRFFSGILQATPQLQPYSHYMRMDDDSFFLNPYITETRVQTMLKEDYAFRSLFHEARPQQGLYDFTMHFLSRNGVNSVRRLQIQTGLFFRKIVTRDGKYTGLAPYNNFHISSLRLWRHPLVIRYLQEIEACGGILRYGWLDANIHAMIAFIFPYVIPIRVLNDVWFGYRHNVHTSPLGKSTIWMDETLPAYPPED
jgi:hypothetical protein